MTKALVLRPTYSNHVRLLVLTLGVGVAGCECDEMESEGDVGSRDSGFANRDSGEGDARADPDGGIETDGGASDAGGTDGGIARVNVWRTAPVAVSAASVEEMGRAFGINGAIVESSDAVQASGGRLGPTGPRVARIVTGTIALGSASERLFASAGAACGNGIDDDSDGLADLLDPDCEGPEDDSESVLGDQVRAFAPGMNVTLDSAGSGAVSGWVPITLTKLTAGGGLVSGTLRAAADGSITVSPRAATVSISLPLELEVSCAGSGCFAGTCVVPLGTTILTTANIPGAAYAQGPGTARVAGSFAVTPVTACTQGASPAAVNQELGLPDPSAHVELQLELTEPFSEIGPTLTVDRTSGTVRLSHARPVQTGPTGPLPTASEAESAARALLDAARLMPPNAAVAVRVEEIGEVETAHIVEFTQRLDVLAGPVEELVEVHEASVHVRVVQGAVVDSVVSTWRPVMPAPLEIERRPLGDVLSDVEAVTGVPGPNDTPLAPELAYVNGTPGDPWPYFDPVVSMRDPAVLVPAAFGALTDFTPSLNALSPAPEAVVDGSAGTVPLAASAIFGEPPYTFEWRSTINGDLGSGGNVDARLSSGRHGMSLLLRDARGAGYRVHYELVVEGSPVPRPLRGGTPTMPITQNTRFTSSNGTSFYSGPVAGRGGPLVSHLNQTGATVGHIYFEQWRYELDITIDGVTYTVHSDKCIDQSLAGGACFFPTPPFAVLSSASGLVHTPAQGMLSSTVVIGNLPGTFTLMFRYRTVNAYAGPAAGAFARLGIWVARGLNTLARQLGGRQPGFVPEVDWTYQPPAGGTIGCGDLFNLYSPGSDSEGTPYVNIPQSVLEIACGNPQSTFPITAFRAWLYTAVHAHGLTDHDESVLTQDTASKTMIGNTDGVLNSTNQPWWAPGNSFSVVQPILNERSAAFVTAPGNRADWDNYHAKRSPASDVAYPGCNTPLYAFDSDPCLHVHFSWFTGTPFPRGQDVNGYLVVSRPGEYAPRQRPSRLVNGEVLANAARRGVGPQVFWHESIASSAACAPLGMLDNTMRPCQVFVSSVFFTH